jgi:uncharacterized membrane protein
LVDVLVSSKKEVRQRKLYFRAVQSALSTSGHAVVAGQCLLLGVDRTCRLTRVTRGLRFAALTHSALGVCFSIYFMYLQIVFIHAFCIYCLVSALTTLLLFITALSHYRTTSASKPEKAEVLAAFAAHKDEVIAGYVAAAKRG